MEMSQLRTFRAVAETLNFTRAAERLHLTQSAVSHQIKALEEELGEPLFIRAKRGVKLSQAGKIALEYVERILDETEALRERIAGKENSPAGRVRVAAATQAFVHLFAPLFESFMDSHPGVDLAFRTTVSTEQTVADILNGAADVGRLPLDRALDVEQRADAVERLFGDGRPVGCVHVEEAPPHVCPTGDLGDARRDVVGRVVDCEPLRPGLAVPNRMDAAIAEMTDPTALEPGVAGVGEVPFWRPIDDLPVGSVVAKAGRTTGVTFGVLRAVGVTYKVDYALGAPLLFTGQVLTSHLAMGGDSGAALLALGEAPSVVGLILGGSRDVTLATPIDDVQRRFDVLAAPARWPARRAFD
jgi:DNA-binding transcriptional LysR family regulator